MKIASLLLILAAALLAYSFSLNSYIDQKAFDERYGAMHEGQSKEYWQLRDEMLTPKFALQDYGVTLLVIATGVVLIIRRGVRAVLTVRSRLALFILAFLAPFITTVAYVFDLLQGSARGEFPHWADSIGIPLMGVPIQFVVLLVWALAHLAFLRSEPSSVVPIVSAFSRTANPWLLLVSAFTALLIVTVLVFGQYWYAVPGLLWLYFYLSLAAQRRAQLDA